MPETTLTTEIPTPKEDILKSHCHLCGRTEDNLVPSSDLSEDIKALVEANAADTKERASVCPKCIELFTRARTQLVSHSLIFEQTSFVLPTALRMDADEQFTGRGVTIAFLDSGFYAHPDLTSPRNRIVAYHSIFEIDQDRTSLLTTDVASWHGMMTSVVAAGNGHLSEGFYRGIASDSEVVLVKVGRTGHIPEQNIEAGLKWILDTRKTYDIRIINISAGGDFEAPCAQNSLCQTVERAVSEGLIVVCAVGNAGMAPSHPVLPPASAPSAIAVGGLDDQNSLDRARRGMYRSSYGPTVDGLQKPEIIAPGIWVAAPILPGTPTAAEARLCSELDAAPDEDLRRIIETHIGIDKDFDEARDLPIPLLRQLITIKLREGNVINGHYKYVDGTSFAAPIVASVIACMLEANSALTPQQVKQILIDTAERVPGVEIDRQGAGVIVPRRAVEIALAMGSPPNVETLHAK